MEKIFFEMVNFDVEDIITTSSNQGLNNGGSGEAGGNEFEWLSEVNINN